MKQNIEITELDIYNFVFSPETLEPAKKAYLESNLVRFQRQIDYCSQLKEINLDEPQQQSIINVADKIIFSNVIELIPSIGPTETKDANLRLAAKSQNLEKKNYSYSFTDSNSDYVIKIINTATETLLYFFSSVPIQKAKITFLPSGTSYTILDPSKPIDILEESTIEKITLEIILSV